ncbi:MAG: energy-coupling factor transporter ATPase [Oscillospiraceae bacterium]|nr:energy-coupling factor transporter ATPase [Oscillospiraceae bacterium]MCI9308700.1 energy-coupling factor transporter ATPase [Oscillospiraceae bacterium]
MAHPILQTEDLTFRYTTEEGVAPTVLDSLTLSIQPGQFVAVLGHNGSGKSTLAKHFNAILLPSGGRVYVDGLDTRDEDKLLDIRRQVGMVFQNPDNQIVASVVEEDVAFGPENLGVPSGEIRERVDASLAAVRMTQYARHAPHLLSGGQKQRVAIAGVLAMSPRCIVLDEPTAMLDPVGRKEVLDTIRWLNRERQITVVLITHHMDEAAQADRLIVMHDGHIVADDRPALVFQNVDGLRALGLEVPEPVALLYELRQAGVDVPLTALTVDECAQILKELLAQGPRS